MIDRLLEADRQLFILLNAMGSDSTDWFWKFITIKYTWIPFFAFILFVLVKKMGWKQVLVIGVVLAALITVTDQTTNLFKLHFQRLRPCSEPTLSGVIRAVQHSKSFSFFSGHAANSMATTVYLFCIMRKFSRFTFLIFVWPLIFAFSRIYLGLHYPLDVFCGYIWGLCWGLLAYRFLFFLKKRVFKIQF